MLLSWLQGKFGPRFFIPKACIPGLYEYRTKLAKLTDEEKSRGCPICMLELHESPLMDADQNLEDQQGANSVPLYKKV
jgi:hypothetical protein